MYNIRAYKFRIYPDAKRELEINKKLILSQQLYNKKYRDSGSKRYKPCRDRYGY